MKDVSARSECVLTWGIHEKGGSQKKGVYKKEGSRETSEAPVYGPGIIVIPGRHSLPIFNTERMRPLCQMLLRYDRNKSDT